MSCPCSEVQISLTQDELKAISDFREAVTQAAHEEGRLDDDGDLVDIFAAMNSVWEKLDAVTAEV